MPGYPTFHELRICLQIFQNLVLPLVMGLLHTSLPLICFDALVAQRLIVIYNRHSYTLTDLILPESG